MNQPVSHAYTQLHPRRAWAMGAALVVAAVPILVLVVGIPLHDSTPGTCDAWPECTHSAREQWVWTAQSWATAGVMLGAFLATAAVIGPWLWTRPVVLRRGSITALCLLVPVTGVFAFILLAVWNADCSDSSWFCFSGPSDALLLGSPGLVTGTASALLVVGLALPRTRAGRTASTVTLTGLAGGVVVAVSGLVAARLVNLIALALGAH